MAERTVTSKMFDLLGTVDQASQSAGNAWGNYFTASANAGVAQANATFIRKNAKNHLEDAAESVRMAGETQKSALDATTNRYLQLGQDIGRLYAGAAGAGIDVSSRTVNDVERSQRIMANRDVAAMNHTAAQAGRQYIRQAKAQRLSYVNDIANASMMEIQADYQKKIAKSQAQNATWSAVAQTVAGMGVFF